MPTKKMPNKFYNRSKIVIIITICVLCIFVGKKFTWDNPKFIFSIAEGFDDPSVPFYILIDQAYKIYSNSDRKEIIANFLDDSKQGHLVDIYIRVAGVIGDSASSNELTKLYDKFDNTANKVSLHYIVTSLGLLGEKSAIPFLEDLLMNQKIVRVSGSTVAVSLFLITGRNNYQFVNSLGNEQKLILTDDLTRARQVILESKNRKRTYKELIILDNLFRAPHYRESFKA